MNDTQILDWIEHYKPDIHDKYIYYFNGFGDRLVANNWIIVKGESLRDCVEKANEP